MRDRALQDASKEARDEDQQMSERRERASSEQHWALTP
jgi:hypothetical protein